MAKTKKPAKPLTMRQAFGRWKKIAGAKATASESLQALAEPEKQRVREQLRPLHDELKAIREAKQTRGNPRYAELEKEVRRLGGSLYGYRCTLGEAGGFPGFPLNFVRGQGDTWDEALAKAEKWKRENS